MSVTLFIEGGGDSEGTLRSFRQGFISYVERLAPAGRKPKVVACGSRNQAFDKFTTAITISVPGDICALLVDSEAPATAKSAVKHLSAYDGWKFPADLGSHRVFLMVQIMESWFLADGEALKAFYDGGFLANSLPGSQANIEVVSKDDVSRALVNATRNTKTKGTYHKIGHGPRLLGLISPDKVEAASKHARHLHDFLRGL